MTKARGVDFYPLGTKSSVALEQKHKYEAWTESLQQPLRATGQKPGKRVDFFIQGLITGGAVVSITLLLGLGMLVNVGYKKLWLSRI